MKKYRFIIQITLVVALMVSMVACDKDFTTLNSDIINTDNANSFDIQSLQYDVITYTKTLNPVQTNNLGLNNLGIYNDIYGRTTASFVTQITPTIFEPSFGVEENTFIEIDSVILTIPYFNSITEVQDDETIIYDIDSVIGRDQIKLHLFENTYFIRDFDPNSEFAESQSYFSDKSVSLSESISVSELEGEELIFVVAPGTSYTTNEDGDNIINISEEGFVLTEPDNEDDDDLLPQVLSRQPPGIRLKLDPEYWQNKIIDQEGEAVLSNTNNFSEYFRGVFFKAEPINDNDNGSFLTLNIGAQTSNIIIYYKRLVESTTDDEEDTIEQATFELRFGQNNINFIDNDFTLPFSDGDSEQGDSRLYLKGGEGAIATIKLFNGDDIDDSSDTTFENWKNFFVETNPEDGSFIRSIRLVNEANLVFYIDQNNLDPDDEPNRIFLYDANNNTPLIDYYLDGLISSLPEFSIFNHLGPLEREEKEDGSLGNGIKYKLKITEHINNLLLRDSTNVDLGLSVSSNVNLEELIPQREVLNTDITVPISSVITPRGTVLHGNNTEDQTKKVYLEIYYTEPKN